jgi:hypothetical protein
VTDGAISNKFWLKDQVCARQEPREQTCEAWDHSLGFDPQRDQAGGRPRPAQTAQGDNDRHYYEGDGLAAALGPRLLCGCGAQEARLDLDIGEGQGRTRLYTTNARDQSGKTKLARAKTRAKTGVVSGHQQHQRDFAGFDAPLRQR